MASLRIKPHEPFPKFKLWLWAILEEFDGREFRIAILRLPSYSLRWSLRRWNDEWHQLALVYYGKTGLRFEWLCIADFD